MKDNPSDKVYTPNHIVDEVLHEFWENIPSDSIILEPFKGEGAFYNKLQWKYPNTDWCEIDEGRDFLKYEGVVDWIITNPPYSIFDKIFTKCLQTADELILVIPVNKVLSSLPRLMEIRKSGFGIKRIHYLGSGRQLNFPFGFPTGAMYLSKGWGGNTEMTYADRCLDAKSRNKTKHYP